MAFLLVPAGEVQLLLELPHRVRLRLRDYSRQCRQDGFSPVFVDDAAVDSRYQRLGVSHAVAQVGHHVLVAFGVRVGHVVAQADVAPEHHRVKFRQLADNLGIEVEDTAIVLPQLLDDFGRHEVAADQVLQRALRYPLGILNITLAPRQLPDEVGVDQLQAEVRLKHPPDGDPVHRGTLHRHLHHAVGLHQTAHVLQLIR